MEIDDSHESILGIKNPFLVFSFFIYFLIGFTEYLFQFIEGAISNGNNVMVSLSFISSISFN